MTTIKSLSISFLSFLVIVSLAGCGSGGGSVPSAGNGSDGGSVPSAGNASGGGSVPSAGNPPASGSGGATPPGVAKLSWTAPTTYTNGTPITGLPGYNLCYGTSPGTYTSTIDAGMATSYTVDGLAPGTYYFTVKAYDSFGNESSYSNEARKIVI
jgi:hypothetical protein